MKRKTFKFLFSYTFLFLLLIGVCFLYWCNKYHKSIMCTYDGMNQHYLIFVYVGRWIRQIVSSLVREHQIVLPMFDMGIGYGSDVLTSLVTHITDPFNWISALVPEWLTEQAYTAVIMTKLYISGLSFAFLCRTRGYDWKNVLVGTVVYVFAASSYIFPLWAFSLNMLYIFPLVIVGIDDLWNKKKSWLFLLSFFWLFFNCFYFAYMAVILTVLYCLSLLISDRERCNTAGKIGRKVVKYLLHGAAAAGLAMPVLLPTLLTVSQSDRIGADFFVPTLYSADYYKKWISGFTSSYMMSDRDCYIGYGVLAFVCVISIFLQKRKYKKLKLEFVFLTAGMLIPAFGSMMNGFSYYANRWVFAYTLLIGIIVVTVLPDLKIMSGRQVGVLAAATAVYSVFLIYENEFRDIKETIILLVIAVFFLLLVVHSRLLERTFYFVVTGLLIVCEFIPARYHFSENYENTLRVNTPRGEAYETVTNAGAMPLLRTLSANTEERFDGSDMGTIYNETMLYGISGMNLYLSLGDSNIAAFHRDIGLLTNATNAYYGLNRRSELEYLMGVNYFLIAEEEENRLPYAYSTFKLTEDSHGQKYSAYQADGEVSLLHAFQDTICEEDWKRVDYIQRQQLLTKALVLEDNSQNTDVSDIPLDDDEISYRMELRNVEKSGSTYVTDGDGSILLYPEQLKALGDGEIYICLEGTDYESGEATGFLINVYGLKDGNRTDYTDRLAGTNNRNHIYENRHDWMINIGYVMDTDSIDAIEINLVNGGTYTFDQIHCYIRTTEELGRSISELNVVEGTIDIETNNIYGNITAEKKGHVLLSIPYSAGWKLWIDGKATKIEKADIAFMAFEVEEGEHVLRMTYCTPGLRSGFFILMFTVCILVVFWKTTQNTED